MAAAKTAQLEETWDAFLAEWPIARLRRMTLQEYTAVGEGRTFTAWMERRLDKLGSIWGGSSFKFGIFSRKDKTPKTGGGGDSYTDDYGWYTKYGASPETAFKKIRSIVVSVAEASARGDYAAIDAADLGESYKWKIAFHYQDRAQPGVVAVFKRAILKAWLKGRVGTIPAETSALHRAILSFRGDRDLMELSTEVWEQVAGVESDDPTVSSDSGGDHDQPLNLILFGPPGTGKTYLTSELAVRICDGVVPESREALTARYRELKNLRRIRFVTFHPSFSYEEFVEGIRPSTENGQVTYSVRPGVLKQVVAEARKLFEGKDLSSVSVDVKSKKLYKMSLGDSTKRENDWVYLDCLENDYICHGFGDGIDFSNCADLKAIRRQYKAARPDGKDDDFAITAVNRFKHEVKTGDLVLVSDGNTHFRAIAQVTGPYAYLAREEGYEHRRAVKWLWTSADRVPITAVSTKRLSQMTIYLIDQAAVKWAALQELVTPSREGGKAPNCVLIIDEINRANLAKTFGELITLLEPSKRLGESDEHETELPYSGEWLGVPPNLYVIGTMNSADRSIALMDTALRRRFNFREMTPRLDLLRKDVEGIDLQMLLEAMNIRIEDLFDRDHVIGHSYLMEVDTFDELVIRFQSQIIPLLQEYFFEDWQRIQRVFNDIGAPADLQIVQVFQASKNSGTTQEKGRRFRVNPVISPAAIQKIYS
ncbi:MAG: AAA family ATPase [Acidobacteria bacterium]|nr:AAA family ATPase [Acidobacteriota bacterium]